MGKRRVKIKKKNKDLKENKLIRPYRKILLEGNFCWGAYFVVDDPKKLTQNERFERITTIYSVFPLKITTFSVCEL